ncbi:MAG: recombination protein O N-terminal domain-containing protein [Verrucomicrobia bacterium]|nr:recombination protein O N-terminal domain-containing protein [Verrucomicrobiota bacterium]
MAGRSVQISGIILKREASGEQFYRLTILSSDQGSVMAMFRRPKRNTRATVPDLFDEVELVLEKKGNSGFGFVKELTINRQRRGLAKSFIALELACELAIILIKNLPRETEVQAVYQLLETGLEAWERRINPEAVFFKCLFVFARLEGYPIKHDWFAKLTHHERVEVATILKTPIAEQTMAAKQVRKWIDQLKHYIQHYTDILL